MEKKKHSGLIQIAVVIYDDQIIYLKEQGINRSEFMRQAVTAHKHGAFKYKFIAENE